MSNVLITPNWLAKEALYMCECIMPSFRWPVLIRFDYLLSARASRSWTKDESPLLVCPPFDILLGHSIEDACDRLRSCIYSAMSEAR